MKKNILLSIIMLGDKVWLKLMKKLKLKKVQQVIPQKKVLQTIKKLLIQKILPLKKLLLNQLKRMCTKILKVFLNPFFKLGRGIRRIIRYLTGRCKIILGLSKKKLTLAVKMLKIFLCKR